MGFDSKVRIDEAIQRARFGDVEYFSFDVSNLAEVAAALAAEKAERRRQKVEQLKRVISQAIIRSTLRCKKPFRRLGAKPSNGMNERQRFPDASVCLLLRLAETHPQYSLARVRAICGFAANRWDLFPGGDEDSLSRPESANGGGGLGSDLAFGQDLDLLSEAGECEAYELASYLGIQNDASALRELETILEKVAADFELIVVKEAARSSVLECGSSVDGVNRRECGRRLPSLDWDEGAQMNTQIESILENSNSVQKTDIGESSSDIEIPSHQEILVMSRNLSLGEIITDVAKIDATVNVDRETPVGEADEYDARFFNHPFGGEVDAMDSHSETDGQKPILIMDFNQVGKSCFVGGIIDVTSEIERFERNDQGMEFRFAEDVLTKGVLNELKAQRRRRKRERRSLVDGEAILRSALTCKRPFRRLLEHRGNPEKLRQRVCSWIGDEIKFGGTGQSNRVLISKVLTRIAGPRPLTAAQLRRFLRIASLAMVRVIAEHANRRIAAIQSSEGSGDGNGRLGMAVASDRLSLQLAETFPQYTLARIQAICGLTGNPSEFAFGDKDGLLSNAKLSKAMNSSGDNSADRQDLFLLLEAGGCEISELATYLGIEDDASATRKLDIDLVETGSEVHRNATQMMAEACNCTGTTETVTASELAEHLF